MIDLILENWVVALALVGSIIFLLGPELLKLRKLIPGRKKADNTLELLLELRSRFESPEAVSALNEVIAEVLEL